jgi:glycerophosphoryl diester phosphodiesterase
MRFLFFLFAPLMLFGKKIEVQGHRGCRGVLPENTLSAFAAAIEAGADALELDCLLTNDKEIVIYHDFSIDPELVTNVDGSPAPAALIRALSLAQIKALDCGKANPAFPQQKGLPGETLPTLQELFTLIRTSTDPNAKTVRLNLEIKRDPFHPQYTFASALMARKIVDLVKTNSLESRVYYSSFDPESLEAVRKIDPHARIAFLKEDDLNNIIETASRLHAQILSPEHILLTDAEIVREFKRLGFKVIVWTVNDPQRWQECRAMGVDGIITDYPEDLIHFLNH